jgi:ribulose-5-phosphate 4-epimerase/fuculose-1-phosphate aldolase
MRFEPTPEKLIPDLSPREELALLARCLWREGYNDHLAGHITHNLGDGTFLCNPWLVMWSELRPHQVIRIDLAGNVVEGEWPAPIGVPLHLALHEARQDVGWAMHNHPLHGTVLSDMRVVPPPMDQASSIGGGELVLVDEYGGGVNTLDTARAVVAKMGDADLALLAGHGVFVLGRSARAVHRRAVALEHRCKIAWHILAAGGTLDTVLPQWWLEERLTSTGENNAGFWEAMVRQELAADPELLDPL